MTTKTNMNGQVRKSLAEQIDRLDGMLDGLSEGLNDAVAAAVKDAVGAAVQQAVQAVLREVLTNPEMLARVQNAVPPSASPLPAPATPALMKPKGSWMLRPWAWVRDALSAWAAGTWVQCGRRLRQARSWLTGAWDRVSCLCHFPYGLLTAVGVGVTVGVSACFAQPWLAKMVGSVVGFYAKTALWVRTIWRRLTMHYVASMG